MKIVHYEYRLKAYAENGELGIQLIAKHINNIAEELDFSAAEDILTITQNEKRRKANITARHYFGVTSSEQFKQDIISETNMRHSGSALKNSRSKISWRTCLKK